jgi:uncharacterized protein YjlB
LTFSRRRRPKTWRITEICTLTGVVVGPLVLGFQIVSAQDARDQGFTISPVPTIHVLLPGELPPGEAAGRSPTGDTAAPVAGVSGAVSAGLQINATFDVSITSDPNAAAIEAAINSAIANIESQFSDPITVAITFQKGSGLGSSSSYYATGAYTTFLAALKADAKTGDDVTAVGLLPSVATNPVNGSTSMNVKLANLRAVGIQVNPPVGQSDGVISLNTTVTTPGSPGSTGTVNLLPVVEHEIDEVLGLGSSLPAVPSGTIFPEDLYRYSGVNTRTFTSTDSRTSGVFAFFSIDGHTALAEFDNQNDGGDFGDWQSNPLRSGVAAKVQDAFATPGANPALGVELTALDVVGYDRVVFVCGTGPIGSATQELAANHSASGGILPKRPAGDFDGDAKSDVTVYRPATGFWYVLESSTNFTAYAPYQCGASTDIPVPGDYDGDGKADVAVYRPTTGAWYVLESSTNFTKYAAYQWGVSTDIPVPGDYDGDGKTDVAVYRPSTGVWYVLQSSTNFTAYAAYPWGVSTDIPVPGDYDGDGKTDVAVYRPATGAWFVLKSSTNFTAYASYSWGVSTDIPVPGDYDGDGKTDVAVYRPATGAWFILKSSTNFTTYSAYSWGVSTDIPVPGDYDGDGKTDVAVYRAATGAWFILKSSSNFTAYNSYQWGASTDIPLLKPD